MHAWFLDLDRRKAREQQIWPAESALSADNREWVDIGAMPPTPGAMPYWAHVIWGSMQGP